MSAPAPPSAPSADNVRVCVRVRPNTAPDRDVAWSVSDAGALLQLDAAGKAVTEYGLGALGCARRRADAHCSMP